MFSNSINSMSSIPCSIIATLIPSIGGLKPGLLFLNFSYPMYIGVFGAYR